MLKLPNGISNYEELVEDEYLYVDKTTYIEKMENLSDKRIMCLRPRKFGKTLFTSVLENYYDILKKDKFEKLFSGTYIGKHPTDLQNSYHILKFNFSGIDTSSVDYTIIGFKNSAIVSIKDFIHTYHIDFIIYVKNKVISDFVQNMQYIIFVFVRFACKIIFDFVRKLLHKNLKYAKINIQRSMLI